MTSSAIRLSPAAVRLIHLLTPIIDRPVKVDLRETITNAHGATAMTQDGRWVSADVMIRWRILDPLKSALSGFHGSLLHGVARTIFRAIVADMALSDVPVYRDRITADLRTKLDEVTARWGATIIDVQLGEIAPLADAPEGEHPRATAASLGAMSNVPSTRTPPAGGPRSGVHGWEIDLGADGVHNVVLDDGSFRTGAPRKFRVDDVEYTLRERPKPDAPRLTVGGHPATMIRRIVRPSFWNLVFGGPSGGWEWWIYELTIDGQSRGSWVLDFAPREGARSWTRVEPGGQLPDPSMSKWPPRTAA